jgi:hypothetical protein
MKHSLFTLYLYEKFDFLTRYIQVLIFPPMEPLRPDVKVYDP